MSVELQQNDIQTLNDWAGFFSFQPNFIIKALADCTAKFILVETGNQAGKTSGIVKDYISRILGRHPIEKKNIRPNTEIRIIRFASETLPIDKDENGEIRNTIYPQFKKFFPHYLIRKDITARRPAVTIRDPQMGRDIIIEFVSYNQEVQSQKGHQRFSIYLDEEAPKSFYEEQLPRLIAADGDLIIGVTPIEKITYLYEDIYERAGIVYNSPTIMEYMKKKGEVHQLREVTMGDKDIAVIRAATDDNPTLQVQAIESLMSKYDDEPTMEVRRYGIFHQISGIIHKDFDRVHIINRDQYFQDGIPHDWLHARGIDFHEHTNWACGWICISKQNEAFIYEEYNPSPDRMVTVQIVREVAHRSKDYRYHLNLIDPLAAKNQPNTGLAPIEDVNRAFREFKKEGIGTGGYWETWDTKSLKGRDVIKERLKNARLCGRPFNNRIVKNGIETYLPTLWILDNCTQTIYSFKSWRWEQWASREALLTKEEKNKPEDRHSHFPITFECIFKHPAFNVGRFKERLLPFRESPYHHSLQARA